VSVSEFFAIWIGGAAVLVLVGLAAGSFLRFTRVGQEQELTLGDVLKILVVVVVLSCGVYTLLALAT
jgi:hypothetical protein